MFERYHFFDLQLFNMIYEFFAHSTSCQNQLKQFLVFLNSLPFFISREILSQNRDEYKNNHQFNFVQLPLHLRLFKLLFISFWYMDQANCLFSYISSQFLVYLFLILIWSAYQTNLNLASIHLSRLYFFLWKTILG